MSRPNLKKRLFIGAAVIFIMAIGAFALFAASTWGDVNRVSIDRPDPEDSSGPIASEDETGSEDGSDDAGNDLPTEVTGRQIFLLVGTDSREDLEDLEGFGDFEGNRADVIMVLFKDENGAGLLSIPRDLLVTDPCGGSDDRINEMLEGCGLFNGPTALTLTVEHLIDQPIDHFALVDFVGFQEAVDAIGGYEICVENPVRDERAGLSLPAGCTNADGEQTLAWMRSRSTQELTDEGWRVMPGMNDLARNERQRTFLIDMMSKVADFTSPQDMLSSAQALSGFVTVDSQLSMMDAVSLAWTMRGLGSGGITQLEIPVYDATTDAGASVLLPSTPVDEIVSEFLSASADTGGGVVLGLAD
jgi:LCP family protein required for cell wall assembly